MPNSFIYLRAIIREGWFDRKTGRVGDPRLEFVSIQLLHDVLDKHSQKITLQLPVEDLSDSFIDSLMKLIETNLGDKSLIITFYEGEEGTKLSMRSTKFRVNISNRLLQELERSQVHYTLN